MPKAYSLVDDQLTEQLQLHPWLTFPDGLVEVLAIFDERGHARHLRCYLKNGAGKHLVGANVLAADSVLALVKAAKCHGSPYDLHAAYEQQVTEVIDNDGDPDEAYQLIRAHLLSVVKIRTEAGDAHATRLAQLCTDLPHTIRDVGPSHEACFDEFDAWYHVAVLRDLVLTRTAATGKSQQP